jgi:hydroxymethylpyrimidine/phosphomethylpyrimidine kinase
MTDNHAHATGPLILVGAIFPVAERGLAADLLAARALGLRALPVCTGLVMAGRGIVTDFVEVPEDAVRAQIEHVLATAAPAGMKVGVLATHGSATAVLDLAEQLEGPVVLDLQISGPDRETVLPPRAISVVTDRLGVPDVVLIDRVDAELISGGEIRSLDDAQVAAQRICRRGARATIIKCGPLPNRHFEVDGEPGLEEAAFATDIFFDGHEFALFEAPLISPAPAGGAGSAHAVALLAALASGATMEEALQTAKQYVTEAIRRATPLADELSLRYFWQQSNT